AHGISRDELKDSPRALTVLNVNSPLKVDSTLLQGAMEMARNGQAVVVTPVAFAGAMSPITLSGSLIQHNAECLGVIALLQMVNPGTPDSVRFDHFQRRHEIWCSCPGHAGNSHWHYRLRTAGKTLPTSHTPVQRLQLERCRCPGSL
ncbi:MAG: hypothetical protein F4Z52_03260, partial [Gammaproteobacteria bacterium]|nr:hypothetical protein [Gammaproteobacteria bacterium]